MTDLETMTLASNLRRYRQLKGLSQKDLASKVGLSADSISKIELGKYGNPGLKYLKSICRVLNVSIGELLMENPRTLKFEIVVSEKNSKVIEAILQTFRNLDLIQ